MLAYQPTCLTACSPRSCPSVLPCPLPPADITTKGIMHAVFERCEYWRLRDAAGKPPGLLGWWPSRSVTFLENHDTGSTQVSEPRGRHLGCQAGCAHFEAVVWGMCEAG